MVIACYPSTRFVTDAGSLVKRFQVPVLILGRNYRRDYELDAWRRTMETLRAQHPIKAP